MKYFPIVLLCITLLTSCSALDATTAIASTVLGEQPALSVDAQVGDRENNLGKNSNTEIAVDDNEGIVTVTSDASQNRKEFHKADTVNIQEGPDWFTMVLLALGWLLPSPQEMYREVKSYFTK